MKSGIKTLVAGMIAVAALASPQAQASLIMETYAGFGSSSFGGVEAGIAGGSPSSTSVVAVVDHWDGSGGAGRYGNNFAFPGSSGNLFDNFGVRFYGFLEIATAGTYNFRINSDDGARLRIDGLDVISNGGYFPPTDLLGNITLAAGEHSLELVYFEGFGGATVELDAKLSTEANYRLVGASDGLQTSTTSQAVPEPGSLALLGLGIAALGLRRRAVSPA